MTSTHTDEYTLAAITTAAEQPAHDRGWQRTDLTYIQAMTELAATANALITTTIAAIRPDQRDWDQLASALGTTPTQARHHHEPPPETTATDF